MNPDTRTDREYQRLRWQCRRGTRELDLILETYLKNHYRSAQPEEQQAFRELLALTDPEIEQLIQIPSKTDSEPALAHLLNRLRMPVAPHA